MNDQQHDDRIAGALTLARAAAALAAPRREAAARGDFSLDTAASDPRPDTIPEIVSLERGRVRDDAPAFLAEIGAALAAGALPELAETISESEALDESALTLLLGLLQAALGAEPGRHWFHYWTSETLRREVPRDGARGVSAALRIEVEQRITLGINLRGRSDGEFLAAVRQVDRDEAAPCHSEPLGALRVLLQCSSFCGPDLSRSLRLAAGHAGAVTANAVTLGLVAGAYYGIERLRSSWPDLLPPYEEEADG